MCEARPVNISLTTTHQFSTTLELMAATSRARYELAVEGVQCRAAVVAHHSVSSSLPHGFPTTTPTWHWCITCRWRVTDFPPSERCSFCGMQDSHAIFSRLPFPLSHPLLSPSLHIPPRLMSVAGFLQGFKVLSRELIFDVLSSR